MDEKTLYILRKVQFEKITGELKALLVLFEFCPTYINAIELDSVSQEKEQEYDRLEKCIDDFIKSINDEFIS